MSSVTTPYLGSKIVLYTKSAIRYEGTLYSIDTKESTVALAKGDFHIEHFLSNYFDKAIMVSLARLLLMRD